MVVAEAVSFTVRKANAPLAMDVADSECQAGEEITVQLSQATTIAGATRDNRYSKSSRPNGEQRARQGGGSSPQVLRYRPCRPYEWRLCWTC